MIIVWSFYSQLQFCCQKINSLHEFSFQFFMKRCMFWYISMKSVKIKINRWTKRVCHRFLPIGPYKSNHIHRFLSIYRLIIRYRFLSIDYSGTLLSHHCWSSQCVGRVSHMNLVNGFVALLSCLCIIIQYSFIISDPSCM